MTLRLRSGKIFDTIHSMRVGIFGGRFDPIHNGHLAVAREVLKMGKVDEVWLSIENQHQWRPIVASAEDRRAMVELAIQSVILNENEGSRFVNKKNESIEKDSSASLRSAQNDEFGEKLKVDMTPVELGGQTETIQVVRKLREKYPQHEFVFIVGSDQLPTFYKWSHWEELLKEVHFLVVARKGSPLENMPANATVIDDPSYEPLEDSATRIRERIKMGKPITGFVPKLVEEYIISHGLYK